MSQQISNHIQRTFFGLVILGYAAVGIAQSHNIPIMNIGDSWSHRTVDGWTGKLKAEFSQTVIGVSGDFIRVSDTTQSINVRSGMLSAPELVDYSQRKSFDQTYILNGKITTRINYDWPLMVGKKWSYDHTTTKENTNAPNLPLTVFNFKTEAEVLTFEETNTTAGKFKAYKIVHKTHWKESSNNLGSQIFTYWYAPDVKRYVKYTFESFRFDGTPETKEITELVSFTLTP